MGAWELGLLAGQWRPHLLCPKLQDVAPRRALVSAGPARPAYFILEPVLCCPRCRRPGLAAGPGAWTLCGDSSSAAGAPQLQRSRRRRTRQPCYAVRGSLSPAQPLSRFAQCGDAGAAPRLLRGCVSRGRVAAGEARRSVLLPSVACGWRDAGCSRTRSWAGQLIAFSMKPPCA